MGCCRILGACTHFIQLLATKHKEIALLTEKQEFEKTFSRKKLLLHYFFNILDHFYAKILENHTDSELLDKLKFVLYYFLVDVEKEKVELEKELVFYQYYIDLEKFRSKKNTEVNCRVVGQIDNYKIIPLLFEPLIGNALKYTKDDVTGWIDITIDASNFPFLNFHCKNNYAPCSSNIISSENGLKILEQRLELCYKNKYSMKINQNSDLYEVMLSINIV
jgi:LytS/YehU family sensor histidine kinase